MKKSITITLLTAFMTRLSVQADAQTADRAALEHELAVTSYNYAVGCSELGNYEEALAGLSHIPTGQLTASQQAMADSLRLKCEAMTGHPMAAHEIALAMSESMALDDQSATFLRALDAYEAARYSDARQLLSEVIEMGQGPRPQVLIEATFWFGQCQYQMGLYEECCQSLIYFNDHKNAETDAQCDALAYYTMGYARLQLKKWHQARLNFERFMARPAASGLQVYADGQKRCDESKRLEQKAAGASLSLPLSMTRTPSTIGVIREIRQSQQEASDQQSVERRANQAAVRQWKDWHARYIE